MPDIGILSEIRPLSAQIEGSPSKGAFKFCGPFTDCPDNAPQWLPLVLFAAFFVVVVLLSRRVRSRGGYRQVTRGPKPRRPFTDPQPGSKKDKDT